VARLLWGNFDFEMSLARTPRPVPETVRRTSAELAAAWVAVADESDLVWTPEVIDEGFFEGLSAAGLPRVRPVLRDSDVPAGTELCPWGWTDALRTRAERWHWIWRAPPQHAVREANSRAFSVELEREWGCGLSGACVLADPAELPAALSRLPPEAGRWVLKAEFGMSARERLLGAGRDLTNETRAWLAKRLAGGAVVLEPCVEIVEEIGLQFDVPEGGGEPRLLGITPLLTDSKGAYRGSRFHAGPLLEHEWSEAVSTCRRAAERLKALGYFGPLGFDAARYRDRDGAIRLRPLQDINARWTMGRLALGFRRLLTSGQCGTWLHVNRPGEIDEQRPWPECARERLPAGARLVPTSPGIVGDRPAGRQSLVLVADSPADLLRAEAACG
jgi:hypothetical protein